MKEVLKKVNKTKHDLSNLVMVLRHRDLKESKDVMKCFQIMEQVENSLLTWLDEYDVPLSDEEKGVKLDEF